MGIDRHSSMNEVLAGLGVADHAACAEFARRQAASSPAYLASLVTAAVVLDEVLWRLCLERVDELMAFKTPDTYPPMSAGVVRSALERASEGDKAGTRKVLAGLRFDHLIALRSATYFLQVEAKRCQARHGPG